MTSPSSHTAGGLPAMTELRTALIGAMLVALGSISMALYTPAMPALVTAFHSDPATVKMTLTIYFCGFAFAQLVCGPLSDAYGRRPVAVGFFAIYLVGSAIAVLSPTVGWLLLGRALQGIGVAAGIAVSRAIVRDQFTGQTSARIMNLIGLMLAVGPAISPTIGGLILTYFGWHAIFLVMAIYGVVAVLVLALFTAETNLAPDPSRAHPRRMLSSYGTLFRDARFLRASLVVGLVLGGLYTLAVLLPFVMIDRVGLSPTQFGLSMLLQTGSYTIGTLVAGRLLRRMDARKLIPVGLGFTTIAGIALALGLRLLPPSLPAVMGPVALWAFGIAMVLPGATTEALAGHPRIAGAASALTGFLQIGGGLAGSAVAALFFGDPTTALATVLPAMAVLAVLSHWMFGPGGPPLRRRAHPEDVEVALDPAGAIGAAGEEIEAGHTRPRR